MASDGVATLSPTASMRPLRTTTVPLAITGPLTVTIFALRMAIAGCESAKANPQHRSSAVMSFFIWQIDRRGVSTEYQVTGVKRCGILYWDLPKQPLRYRDAGVNIDEADRAV